MFDVPTQRHVSVPYPGSNVTPEPANMSGFRDKKTVQSFNDAYPVVLVNSVTHSLKPEALAFMSGQAWIVDQMVAMWNANNPGDEISRNVSWYGDERGR